MIDFPNGVIRKDGSIVAFPADNGGKPAAMISGFDGTEVLRLAKVTSDGKLMVDASVSVTGITIGSVGLDLPDSTSAVGPVHRVSNPDALTSAMYVQDQRSTYSSGSLSVLSKGSDGIANRTLLTDANGRLAVNVASMPANVSVMGSDQLFATASYNSTDAYTDVRSMDVRHYVNKTVVAKCITNSVDVRMVASVDGGINYDIVLSNGSTVPAGGSLVIDDSRAFTHIKIQAKNTAAGVMSSLETRAYVMGA